MTNYCQKRLISMNGDSFLTATGSADRMSPRHVFETRIGTGLHRDSQRLTLEGWSRDLREGSRGAFVAQALVPGKFVTLEIPLPDSDKQVIPMRVARALNTVQISVYGVDSLRNARGFGRR